MASGQAGRTQVRAYRFATRQMEWAITQGDPLLHSDPGQLPRRWTLVSMFVGIALLVGFGVFGLIKPAPNWRESALLLDTDSGTLYVNRAGTVYPALNLTSALLASDSETAGRSVPKEVSADDLFDAPRGALMGIPGAPGQLPAQSDLLGPQWGVCDSVTLDESRADPADYPTIVSSVVIGQPTPGMALNDNEALLASIDPGGPTEVDYLIWNGHRSRIDPTNQVIAEALQLADARPRSISVGLLNAIPEVAPITVPEVAQTGSATGGFAVTAEDGTALLVGAVFKVARAGNPDTFHLVHADGVEQISATMADLLRFQGAADGALPNVAPRVLAAAPAARSGLVASEALPATVPRLIDVANEPLVCAGWEASGGEPRWVVTAGAMLPTDSPAVVLAGTNSQAGVSQVLIAPSHGAVVKEYVQGQSASDLARIYLVNDLGVAYPLTSIDALRKLGFNAEPGIAPKQVLDLLPRGPVLDLAAASQLWDAIPDPASMTAAPTNESTVPVAEGTAAVASSTSPPAPSPPASEPSAAPTS